MALVDINGEDASLVVAMDLAIPSFVPLAVPCNCSTVYAAPFWGVDCMTCRALRMTFTSVVL